MTGSHYDQFLYEATAPDARMRFRNRAGSPGGKLMTVSRARYREPNGKQS